MRYFNVKKILTWQLFNSTYQNGYFKVTLHSHSEGHAPLLVLIMAHICCVSISKSFSNVTIYIYVQSCINIWLRACVDDGRFEPLFKLFSISQRFLAGFRSGVFLFWLFPFQASSQWVIFLHLALSSLQLPPSMSSLIAFACLLFILFLAAASLTSFY